MTVAFPGTRTFGHSPIMFVVFYAEWHWLAIDPRTRLVAAEIAAVAKAEAKRASWSRWRRLCKALAGRR